MNGFFKRALSLSMVGVFLLLLFACGGAALSGEPTNTPNYHVTPSPQPT